MHDPVTRRHFLGHALGNTLGTALAAPLGAGLLCSATPTPAAATFLVVVNLRGGNDGLNTVVPLNSAVYARRRPTIGIPRAAARPLAGPAPNANYGLHPALSRFGALYDAGEAAVVNLVGYPNANLSHEESMDIWSRGVRQLGGSATPSGWIARYKDRYAREALDVVGLGTGRLLDFQGGETAATVLQSLTSFGFAQDDKFPASSRLRNQVIRDVLASSVPSGDGIEVRRALLLAYDQVERMQNVVRDYRSTVVYPQGALAGRLKEAAMLVQAGLDTRVFYAQTGGYDTHSDQGGVSGTHAGLLGGVDAALGAFAQDLKAMGAWPRAIVVVISEFGRRNDENGSRGTDHGSGSVVLAMGGALRGGFYGREHTEQDLEQPHSPYAVDFRTIYKEILERHLRADPGPVFSEPIANETPLGLVL